MVRRPEIELMIYSFGANGGNHCAIEQLVIANLFFVFICLFSRGNPLVFGSFQKLQKPGFSGFAGHFWGGFNRLFFFPFFVFLNA